jgi:hypothetical protein
VPTEAETVSNISQAVSAIGRRAGLSTPGEADWQSSRSWRFAMRRRITNWMNDDPWMMGVFEPILLLLFIAVIGVLLELL